MELGPAGWKIVRLGDIGRWFSGGTPSMGNPAYWSGDIPWVSPKDMKVSRLHDAIDHVNDKAINNGTRLLPAGALLMVIRGMILAHSFPVARAERSLAFNQDLKAVVTRDDVDSNFMLHWLLSNAQQLRSLATESTHGTKRIPTEGLFRTECVVPPILEQRAIAEALGDVDALLRALIRLIAKKRDLKQAAMQQLLTGRNRLPGFSGEWETRRLGELFSISGGLSASRDQLSDSGICYLHYGDIHKSSKCFIDVEAEFIDIPKLDVPLAKVPAPALLEDGDVVFVDASEDEEGASKHVVIVNPARIPYISGLHTIVAKSRSGTIDNGYKRYCFQSQKVKQQFRFYVAGTKVSGISKTSIAKILLTFPPTIAEQAEIAAVLADMDGEIGALETRLAKTRALKQGMMQELLTGRVRLVPPASRRSDKRQVQSGAVTAD